MQMIYLNCEYGSVIPKRTRTHFCSNMKKDRDRRLQSVSPRFTNLLLVPLSTQTTIMNLSDIFRE